jgi:hypothetical protein
MHYHVKVGLPASSFKEATNWDNLREQIRAEVDMVMFKYDDGGAMSEEDMREFGIMPHYTEEDDDGDRRLYNPEGIYDWYEIGGRWTKDMMPHEYDSDFSKKFRELYVSLHTNKLHNGCSLPMHVITLEEPHDMQSIRRHEPHDDYEKMSFREYMIAVINKTGQYDDYIWTTVDIHN